MLAGLFDADCGGRWDQIGVADSKEKIQKILNNIKQLL